MTVVQYITVLSSDPNTGENQVKQIKDRDTNQSLLANRCVTYFTVKPEISSCELCSILKEDTFLFFLCPELVKSISLRL